MNRCSACDSPVEPIISFGPMPLANGFLQAADFASEYFVELAFGFCERCSMAQLIGSVPREKMFHNRYPFFTASSKRMAEHFRHLADQVMRDWVPNAEALVVEVGSNDGTLLRQFATHGIRHLGIEPSANVATMAMEQGVRTLCRFLDEDTARDVVRSDGQADIVLAANCFCHIPDLQSLARSLDILLKPRGILIFEDPYIGDIVEKVAYDQIYDEHAQYFSVTSVVNWLSRHGFELVGLQPQSVHGGSMRYFVARRETLPRAAAVDDWLRKEKARGLADLETYRAFNADIQRSRLELVGLLQRLKRDGKRVAGYAATSKSTTVLNYCGIDSSLISFICDTTPMKHGKYSPGTHIPIRPHEQFQSRYPDYAVLFAWNHGDEIMEKERGFADAGGRWITYVPTVRVFETHETRDASIE